MLVPYVEKVSKKVREVVRRVYEDEVQRWYILGPYLGEVVDNEYGVKVRG